MRHRIGVFLIVFLTTPIQPSPAQIVRFETSLGDFDVELFPDKAPVNVANFLSYVTSGRYDNTVINRADFGFDENFVVQMGSFSSVSAAPPPDTSGFIDIVMDPAVMGEPAATTGLSHTIGTVGFALDASPDSATSSFFVNGRDNSFLDSEFTVFGQVTNLSSINTIFAAPQLDGTSMYGLSLAYRNIPLQSNGDLVFINSAYVIPEPTSLCLAGGLIAVTVLFGRPYYRPSVGKLKIHTLHC